MCIEQDWIREAKDFWFGKSQAVMRFDIIAPVFATFVTGLLVSACLDREQVLTPISPGVRSSSAAIRRDLILNRSELNVVRALTWRVGGAFTVAGDSALCDVDARGSVERCTRFPLPDIGQVFLLATPTPGLAILSGLWGDPAAASFSPDRGVVWRYQAAPSPVDVVTTGGREYVVLAPVDGGLVYLDAADGALAGRMHTPDAVGVATGDFDGDSGGEVVLMPYQGPLHKISGLAESRLMRELGFAHSKPVSTRCGASPSFLFVASKSHFYALSPDLRVQRTWELPHTTTFTLVAAATSTVRTGDGVEQRFYAFLLAGPPTWHRTLLFIFTEAGSLVLEEVLPDDFRLICSDAFTDGTTADFVLGGRGVLWRYRVFVAD